MMSVHQSSSYGELPALRFRLFPDLRDAELQEEEQPRHLSSRARKRLVRRFSPNKSTEEHFSIVDDHDHGQEQQRQQKQQKFYGAYGHIRKSMLDYHYHVYYRKERQWLHDAIIEDCLLQQEDYSELTVSTSTTFADDDDDDDVPTKEHKEEEIMDQHHPQKKKKNGYHNHHQHISKTSTNTPPYNWFILAVGVHGAGKHFVIRELVATNRLLLNSFVCIDTDDIRKYLPEYSTYLSESPDRVDALTRKEAGYISETLAMATLSAGRNAIFHCNLKDYVWYRDVFLPNLRNQFHGLRIALLHVVADPDIVLDRVRSRAQETGKIKPITNTDLIDALQRRIPEAVEELVDEVDFTCTIRNNREDELELLDKDWTTFVDTFDQQNNNANRQELSAYPSLSADSGCCSPPTVRHRRSVTIGATPQQQQQQQASERRGSHSHLYRRHSLMKRRFSPFQSSEENHKAEHMDFFGQFAHIRETLDYHYHKNYTFERQLFQDAIIREFLQAAVVKDQNGDVCTRPTEPWLVNTAGAMGAGKGWTLKKLVETGRFPLMAFVRVDPDVIRRLLPDFHLYVRNCPERAGELTNKEAGYIAEILTLAGLQAGKNVIVDGSLRRSGWYSDYFARLRQEFRNLRIAIIHVTAPREAVFQRAAERALHTGRIVPRTLLIEALEQVPRSVNELAPLVDYHIELRNCPNASDIEIVTPGETWESFKSHWIQTCAWIPKSQSQERLIERYKHRVRKLKAVSES